MIKFDYAVNTIIAEGRTAKNDVYSNIEIDATGFQTKLVAGEVDGLIQEWSGKSWLGGIPAEKLREIMNKIAADLIEYPPTSYEEMQGTISSVVSKAINRKDLQVKLTRKVSNLLTTEGFKLITVKKAESTPEQTVSQKRTGQNPDAPEKKVSGNVEGTRFNANASWDVMEAEGRKLDGDDRAIFYRVWEVVEPIGAEINPKNIKEVYAVIGGELEARKFLQRLVNRDVIVPVDATKEEEEGEGTGELPVLDRTEEDNIDPEKELGSYAPSRQRGFGDDESFSDDLAGRHLGYE